MTTINSAIWLSISIISVFLNALNLFVVSLPSIASYHNLSFVIFTLSGLFGSIYGTVLFTLMVLDSDVLQHTSWCQFGGFAQIFSMTMGVAFSTLVAYAPFRLIAQQKEPMSKNAVLSMTAVGCSWCVFVSVLPWLGNESYVMMPAGYCLSDVTRLWSRISLVFVVLQCFAFMCFQVLVFYRRVAMSLKIYEKAIPQLMQTRMAIKSMLILTFFSISNVYPAIYFIYIAFFGLLPAIYDEILVYFVLSNVLFPPVLHLLADTRIQTKVRGFFGLKPKSHWIDTLGRWIVTRREKSLPTIISIRETLQESYEMGG